MTTVEFGTAAKAMVVGIAAALVHICVLVMNACLVRSKWLGMVGGQRSMWFVKLVDHD